MSEIYLRELEIAELLGMEHGEFIREAADTWWRRKRFGLPAEMSAEAAAV